ncbi:MAG: phosphatidylinositol 4-kinase [Acidobacteriota bacterium]|nr:phosphatidylinositol 4-kinase [Acidobacteriota bacterium]
MRTVLVALLLTSVAPSASGVRAAPEPGLLRAQATAPAAASAKIWEGRNGEFEAFIATAPLDRFEEIPIGVTKPRRAFFRPGGLLESVAWKVLPPGRPNGYWESYKSEIAAYELDKLLGMGMVPVAVEKRWKHEIAAAILWVAPVNSWKSVQARPKPEKWNRQAVIMKMFDNLICNKDRNLGNLLVDDDWNVFLIDHSRAFIESKDLPVRMTRVDREVWNRMLSLDEPALAAAMGKWIDGRARRALLARRDKMKVVIDGLVKTSGQELIFIQ